MCLEMAVSLIPAGAVGNPLPGRRRSAASGPSSRHLWKAGSVKTYTLPPSFSSVAGFGCPKWTSASSTVLISNSPAREASLSQWGGEDPFAYRLIPSPLTGRGSPQVPSCLSTLLLRLISFVSYRPVGTSGPPSLPSFLSPLIPQGPSPPRRLIQYLPSPRSCDMLFFPLI